MGAPARPGPLSDANGRWGARANYKPQNAPGVCRYRSNLPMRARGARHVRGGAISNVQAASLRCSVFGGPAAVSGAGERGGSGGYRLGPSAASAASPVSRRGVRRPSAEARL